MQDHGSDMNVQKDFFVLTTWEKLTFKKTNIITSEKNLTQQRNIIPSKVRKMVFFK